MALSARCSLMPSTAIRAAAYRAAQRELEIVFTSGRRYVYRDVPPRVAEALRAAPSKGRYFNARIRDRYAFTELAGDPA
jgi:lysyl-tRNA synthetase class 2